jgi:hypothetical protein
MGERYHYLAFAKRGDIFYALDKNNVMNKWSTLDGKLLSKTELKNANYSNYQVDR